MLRHTISHRRYWDMTIVRIVVDQEGGVIPVFRDNIMYYCVWPTSATNNTSFLTNFKYEFRGECGAVPSHNYLCTCPSRLLHYSFCNRSGLNNVRFSSPRHRLGTDICSAVVLDVDEQLMLPSKIDKHMHRSCACRSRRRTMQTRDTQYNRSNIYYVGRDYSRII